MTSTGKETEPSLLNHVFNKYHTWQEVHSECIQWMSNVFLAIECIYWWKVSTSEVTHCFILHKIHEWFMFHWTLSMCHRSWIHLLILLGQIVIWCIGSKWLRVIKDDSTDGSTYPQSFAVLTLHFTYENQPKTHADVKETTTFITGKWKGSRL